MNVCVFCSGQEVDQKYMSAAQELGRLLGRRGHTLIWGGSDGGLMRAIAGAVQEDGGRIIGISVELLREKARKNADEMIFAKDISERKGLLLSRSDCVVTLPGGTGTLDEVSNVLELKKHSLYEKPVVFLNTDNFYEGLLMQFKRMKDDGFMEHPLEEFAYFANTPKETVEYLEKNFHND